MARTDNDTWDLATSVGATANRADNFDDFFIEAAFAGISYVSATRQ